jgi:hypothetical protein
MAKTSQRGVAVVGVIAFIWIAIEVVGLIDALRRPGSDWEYADRDRPFWVVFMFFLGPLAVAPYLFLVCPRFANRVARERSSTFRKR